MKNKIIISALMLFIAIGVIWITSSVSDQRIEVDPELALASATAFYDPYCGCCVEHINYMERMGFDMDREPVADVQHVKVDNGVPSDLFSCHTTIIDGYVVEGHMPMEAIKKLLDEKPNIKGIALPGMPSGSPGMPGMKMGKFNIHQIHHDGSTSTFMEI